MLVIKLAVLLLSGYLSRAEPTLQPIVKGHDADKGEYPWQVLLKHDGGFVCGGSLIRDDVVLTAGHCVEYDVKQKKGKFVVILGEHHRKNKEGTEVTIDVANVILHPDYNTRTVNNDIALLILEESVNLTSDIQLVPQLSTTALDKAGRKSKDALVSGWGIVNDKTGKAATILQELDTNIISNRACNKKLSKFGLDVTPQMVCTFNRKAGICSGDSGGPMGFIKAGSFVQVGIVSWGPNAKCINGRQVFTRVSKFIDWIEDQLI